MTSGLHSYLGASTTAMRRGPPGSILAIASLPAISGLTPGFVHSVLPVVSIAAMPLSLQGTRRENVASEDLVLLTIITMSGRRRREKSVARKSLRRKWYREELRRRLKSLRTSSALR